MTHEDRVKYLRDSVLLPDVEARPENKVTWQIVDGETVIVAPTKQLFPKEIVGAYKILISAQEMFDSACKEYAPEAPMSKGNKIKYKKINWPKYKHGEVVMVKYQPYSNNNNFGAWQIKIRPLNSKLKPYKNETINKSYEFLESTDKVILCIQKKRPKI